MVWLSTVVYDKFIAYYALDIHINLVFIGHLSLAFGLHVNIAEIPVILDIKGVCSLEYYECMRLI